MKQRRVVVTGLGALTPIGLSASSTWQRALEGYSGICKVSSLPENCPINIGGVVKDLDIDSYLSAKEQRRLSRFIILTLGATKEAMKDSHLEITEELSHQTGCIIGVGMGGLEVIEQQMDFVREGKYNRITPFAIPSVISNLAPGQVSLKYNLKGPSFAITSACASGNHAIGEATSLIQKGLCEVVLTGGAESALSPFSYGGFSALRALSKRMDEPTKASRPWDKDRDGFVMGEGAAVLVLEEYERAQRRGASIYAEIKGYGFSSDAYHITSPDPEGLGAQKAMNLALKDAQLSSDKIDYINAHGTSTPVGDIIESKAIEKVFKDHSKKILVNSTKSLVGHTLGAAGAIESIISIYSLKDNKVHPTINLDNPDPECTLDYVPHEARDKQINYVLNNSFGFGGTNACLIFGKV